jgi:hypothetical protein
MPDKVLKSVSCSKVWDVIIRASEHLPTELAHELQDEFCDFECSWDEHVDEFHASDTPESNVHWTAATLEEEQLLVGGLAVEALIDKALDDPTFKPSDEERKAINERIAKDLETIVAIEEIPGIDELDIEVDLERGDMGIFTDYEGCDSGIDTRPDEGADAGATSDELSGDYAAFEYEVNPGEELWLEAIQPVMQNCKASREEIEKAVNYLCEGNSPQDLALQLLEALGEGSFKDLLAEIDQVGKEG